MIVLYLQIFCKQNYDLFRISAPGLFLTIFLKLNKFQLDILTKTILVEKKKMRVYFRNDRRFVSAIAVETIRYSYYNIEIGLNCHTFSYERFPSSVILEDNLNLVCYTLVLTSNKMTFERLCMSKRVISKKQLVRWQLLCAYIKISAVINFSQNSRVLTRLV